MDAPREPRWLDQEEQRTWLAFAGTLSRLPSALDAQLQRDAGLSHFEYLVMAGLSMAVGRTLRMSDVAEFTNSSLSRLSNVVNRLERRGWVRRSPDPADGRYTLAALTDDGWDKVVATAPGHVAEVRRLVFDPLTKAQQRHLRQISGRIMHTVDPAGCDPDDRLRSLLLPAPSTQDAGQHANEDAGQHTNEDPCQDADRGSPGRMPRPTT